MWDQFNDLGSYESHVIDTTECDPAETVDRLMQLMENGRLPVGGER
jgi:hypothetical protein